MAASGADDGPPAALGAPLGRPWGALGSSRGQLQPGGSKELQNRSSKICRSSGVCDSFQVTNTVQNESANYRNKGFSKSSKDMSTSCSVLGVHGDYSSLPRLFGHLNAPRICAAWLINLGWTNHRNSANISHHHHFSSIF